MPSGTERSLLKSSTVLFKKFVSCKRSLSGVAFLFPGDRDCMQEITVEITGGQLRITVQIRNPFCARRNCIGIGRAHRLPGPVPVRTLTGIVIFPADVTINCVFV